MTAPISHIEWRCTNLETSREFLACLFGWKFLPFGTNYLLYTPAQGTCVGLIQADQVVTGNSCLVFVQVEDIDQTIQEALNLGGKGCVAKTRIVDYGWYAQIKDPDGNIIGLFEDMPKSSDATV